MELLRRPTLFVIGAGAGYDIGMPLGDKLRQDIAFKLNFYAPEFGAHRGSKAIFGALGSWRERGGKTSRRIGLRAFA